MTLPRLLLVSDVIPGAAGVGGVYLHDLCAMYEPDRLACCVIGEGTDACWPSTLAGVAHVTVPRPPEHGFLRLGRHVHGTSRHPYERYIATRTRRGVVPRIVAFGRDARAEAVWVPLASPTAMRVAAPVAETLGVPLLSLVWDPPRYYLSEYWKLRGKALDSVLASFDHALRRSARCGVMSDEMGRAYRAAHGTRCVVMQHGIARRWWRPPATAPAADRLTIAYAGSLYAREEWNALVAGLAAVGWRIGGREVVIRFLGSRLDMEVRSPARIEFFGWRDRAETLALLAGADVCYLPYWFAPRYGEVVRQAFPTKLPTYLAAGRPVLVHAPAESSPARFLEQYPAGVACASPEPQAVVAALAALVEDRGAYRRAAEATRAAMEQCFDLEIFRARFADLLGVEPGALRPADSVA